MCPGLINLIKLGICAMPRKINNPHMKNILDNFQSFEEFEIIIFTEDIIFKQEIENWPIVDALIIFYSDGFPYNKALKYINLRKPFLINDFEMQKVFWDRVKVLKLLEEANIPIPPHIIIEGCENEEINNDGKINDLNNSFENEKKVERYKKQINDLENEENNKILDMKRIINKGNNNIEKDNNQDSNSTGRNKMKSSDKLREQSNYEKRKSFLKSMENDLMEFDDHIEYHGKKLYKPFVEKPLNGDDHDIYIYYPPNLGGGHKRLFRKTKEYSSFYFPTINEIRRDKKYIYEKFLQTDGFDIKVYTIGENYAHAEARKSPTLDGKVNRTPEGKEVRYPINLTPKEKEIARKIVIKFKQNICGFDILRYEGNSYVCDVNGFSFVKGNKKYYEDCSILIREIVYKGLKLPLRNNYANLVKAKAVNIYRTLKVPKLQRQTKEELRSIVAVFRHADRSPKQKMKLVIEDKIFLSLFDEFGKNNGEKGYLGEIKLKKPKELKRVLSIVNEILEKKKEEKEIICTDINFYSKIFQIKMVLERNLNFDGLTRKIQLKPLKYEEYIDSSGNKRYIITKALMILKWGGFLTHTGSNQAKVLGETFRVRLYPTSDDEKTGLLRLHATYRHDLKCYSADEGRCLKTAANFLAGLLEIEGNIIPIITSMVNADEKNNKLLDMSSDEIHEIKKKIKMKLSECLNYDGPIKDKFNSLFTKESIYPTDDSSENNSDDEGFPDIFEGKENGGCSSSESSEENNTEEKNPENNKNLNQKKKEKEKEEKPIYELLNKIGNPLQRMKNVIRLLKNVIKNLQKYLSEENNEKDYTTYFITNKNQIERRENDFLKKTQEHLVTKILGEDKKEINDQINNKEIKKVELKRKNSDKINQKNKNKNLLKNEEEKKVNNDKNEIKNELTFDCLDENIALIYKRYVKLKNDFYNTKKDKFDISKIPDIYDNIKYDLIHNKDLMDSNAYELFDEISILANFVMPFEYGITRDEKINIGLKIIKPLLNKILSDLIDINSSIYSKKRKNSNIEEDKNWSGLDASKMNANEVKSTGRHVKSRFYFTCASHIYALLNIIGYGYNSILTHNNKKSFEEFMKIFDFDYCSHIIFRLFEDLNVDLQNPKRFRLEIIMSPGSNQNPKEANKEHSMSVAPWIFLNKNLNVEKMKQFLSKFN